MTLCGRGIQARDTHLPGGPPALAPRHPKGLANASLWPLRQPGGFPRMDSLRSPLSHTGCGSREIPALGLLTPNPSGKGSKDNERLKLFSQRKNPSHIRVLFGASEGTVRRNKRQGRLWEGAGRAPGRSACSPWGTSEFGENVKN